METKKPIPHTQIPVLITWDVDPDTHASFENRQRSIQATLDLCQALGIQTTFFVTARVDHISPGQLARILADGHEIGCHGLTHRTEEDYNQMSQDMQRDYIQEATQKLEAWSGTPIRSFRSPRVKTSARTLRLLSDYGYRADSSVCSQRIDFISSNTVNRGWIKAPRQPYHPHREDPFKRGDLPIWEIPISALVMPFISSFLRVAGVGLTKMFFRLLRAESRRRKNPIVYLAHPLEFVGKTHRRVKLEHFSPSFIRTHGLRLRNYLYRIDGETCLEATRELFAYMASQPDVTFMTVHQYVSQYLDDKV